MITTWLQDQDTNGTPVAVDAGERIKVSVSASVPTGGPDTVTGTVDMNFAGVVTHVPMSMFVADVTASVGTHTVTVVQGDTAAVPVAVGSNAGPDTDVPFSVTGTTPGVTVSSPTMHVARHASADGQILLTTDRTTEPGTYTYDLAASAFDGQQQTALGTLDLVVTPRPTLDLTVDVGAAERLWNSQLAFLCDRLRDGAGRAVLANIGRSIRDPQCYLAPAALHVTKIGSQLQLNGEIKANWLSFYVTTPDGIPGVLDPKFQVDFDVDVALTISVPETLDGNSALKVTAASIDIRNAKVDSHNLTGDIVKGVAMLFGDGAYFHAADYGFSDESAALANTINQTLAAVNGPMQQAIVASGFTTLTSAVDPTGHLVTLHLA